MKTLCGTQNTDWKKNDTLVWGFIVAIVIWMWQTNQMYKLESKA